MSALSESTQRPLPIFAANSTAVGRNLIAANTAGVSVGKGDKPDAASSFANILKSRLHREKANGPTAATTAAATATAAEKSTANLAAPASPVDHASALAATTLPSRSEIAPDNDIAILSADAASLATPTTVSRIDPPFSNETTPPDSALLSALSATPATPSPDFASVSAPSVRPSIEETLALADSRDLAQLRALLASMSSSTAATNPSDSDSAIDEALPIAASPDVVQLRALLANAANSTPATSPTDSDSAIEEALPMADSPDFALLRALLANVSSTAATVAPPSPDIESDFASADIAELSARLGVNSVATPTSDKVSASASDEESTDDSLTARSLNPTPNDAMLANTLAFAPTATIDPPASSASASLEVEADSYVTSATLPTPNSFKSPQATRLPMDADVAANVSIDAADAPQALPSPIGLDAPTASASTSTTDGVRSPITPPIMPMAPTTTSQLSAAETPSPLVGTERTAVPPPVDQAAALQKDAAAAMPTNTASSAPATEIPPTPLSAETPAPRQELTQAMASANKPVSLSNSLEPARKSTRRDETTTSVSESAAPTGKIADTLPITSAKTAEAPDSRAPHSGDTLPAGDFRAAMEQANAAAQAAPATPAPAERLPIETPLGQSGWDEEIGQKLTWMTNNEQHKAELVLTPPNMGRIEVSLTMDGDQVSAIFTSPHAAVREALENSLDRLREQMADAGIVLGNTQVGTESQQQSSQHSANRHERHGHFRFGKKPDGQYASSLDTPAPAAASQHPAIGRRGLVDIFA